MPERDLVILHFSDLHFSFKENGSTALRTRVIQDVAKHFQEKNLRADVVVTSGDWFHQGKHKLAQEEMSLWLKNLCDTLGIGREQILSVPGNHDLSQPHLRRNHHLHRKSPKRAQRHLAAARRKLDKGCPDCFKNYREAIEREGIPDYDNVGLNLYGVKTFDHIGLRLICANSAWLSGYKTSELETPQPSGKKKPRPREEGSLFVGKQFLEKHLAVLTEDDGYLNVGVLHHPGECLHRLDRYPVVRDWSAFHPLLNASSLVLCGHLHPNKLEIEKKRNLAGGTPQIIGGALAVFEKDQFVFFQALRINREAGKIYLTRFAYQYDPLAEGEQTPDLTLAEETYDLPFGRFSDDAYLASLEIPDDVKFRFQDDFIRFATMEAYAPTEPNDDEEFARAEQKFKQLLMKEYLDNHPFRQSMERDVQCKIDKKPFQFDLKITWRNGSVSFLNWVPMRHLDDFPSFSKQPGLKNPDVVCSWLDKRHRGACYFVCYFDIYPSYLQFETCPLHSRMLYVREHQQKLEELAKKMESHINLKKLELMNPVFATAMEVKNCRTSRFNKYFQSSLFSFLS